MWIECNNGNLDQNNNNKKKTVTLPKIQVDSVLSLLSHPPKANVSTSLDSEFVSLILGYCRILMDNILKFKGVTPEDATVEDPSRIEPGLIEFGNQILQWVGDDSKLLAGVINLFSDCDWFIFKRGVMAAFTAKLSDKQIKINVMQQYLQWIHLQDLATQPNSHGFSNFMSLYVKPTSAQMASRKRKIHTVVDNNEEKNKKKKDYIFLFKIVIPK
jgi:hypothetical protein